MIGDIIAELRIQRGWPQTLLAKKLNVSSKTIKNWESGLSDPSAVNIAELARTFSVSADCILGVASSAIIILDSLPPADRKMLYAIFQAYISNC